MLDSILNTYCSTDQLRPALCLPCTLKEYTWATDAHAFIRIPNTLLEKTYEIPEGFKYPDVEPSLRDARRRPTPLVVKPEKVRAFLASARKVISYEDCDKCEGCGTIECHTCRQEHDCPTCDGSGHGKVIGAEISFYVTVDINRQHFSGNLIKRLIDTADTIQQPIQLISQPATEEKVAIFQIGEVIVGIMPKQKVKGSDPQDYFEYKA